MPCEYLIVPGESTCSLSLSITWFNLRDSPYCAEESLSLEGQKLCGNHTGEESELNKVVIFLSIFANFVLSLLHIFSQNWAALKWECLGADLPAKQWSQPRLQRVPDQGDANPMRTNATSTTTTNNLFATSTKPRVRILMQ